MEDGHCLRPVLLLLVEIFSLLLNVLEQVLNVQPEDIQEVMEVLHRLEQEPRSRSTSLLSNQGMPVPSVTFTTENDSVLRKCTTLTKE